MGKFITLYEICELYFEAVRHQHPPRQAEHIINEFRSALFRLLLPEWGFVRKSQGRKMTDADVRAATDRLWSRPVDTVATVLIESGFHQPDPHV